MCFRRYYYTYYTMLLARQIYIHLICLCKKNISLTAFNISSIPAILLSNIYHTICSICLDLVPRFPVPDPPPEHDATTTMLDTRDGLKLYLLHANHNSLLTKYLKFSLTRLQNLFHEALRYSGISITYFLKTRNCTLSNLFLRLMFCFGFMPRICVQPCTF